MIVGRSVEDRLAHRRAWKRRFAWVPVRLFDGRWLWWRRYWVRTSTAHPYDPHAAFLRAEVQRVAERPEGLT